MHQTENLYQGETTNNADYQSFTKDLEFRFEVSFMTEFSLSPNVVNTSLILYHRGY